MNATHCKTFYAGPRLLRTHLIEWQWERRTWAPVGEGHDASRAEILTSFAPRYLPTERVRVWLANGLPDWLCNPPPWFTDTWIQRISRQLDEDLLPLGLRAAERKRQYDATLHRLVHSFSLGIDLQEFEGALAAAEEAQVNGNLLNRARNMFENAKQRQQEAKDSVACEFWFIRAECIRRCTDERLPSYSELRATRPDWLVSKVRTLKGACPPLACLRACPCSQSVGDAWRARRLWSADEGAPLTPPRQPTHRACILRLCIHASGHAHTRRAARVHADAGQHQHSVSRLLGAHPRRQLVHGALLDTGMCSTPLPPFAWATTLSCSVRRSSQFEAYLAFRKASTNGLGDALDPAYRTTIVPILGVGQSVGRHILKMWGRATASDARVRLGSDDVQVTNKSDKLALLPKLDVLDAMARSCILSSGEEIFVRATGGDLGEHSLVA